MGQLAPVGTGSFDIVIDAKAVNDNAKKCFNGENHCDSEEGTPYV